MAADDHRLIRALRRQPVDRTPAWIMRQAGRYLPEYRALRERAGDFMHLCKTPELAAEATLQPLRRFPLDAAIVFSDILTIPDAMGLGLRIDESRGPRFARAVTSDADIAALRVPEPERELRYVLDTVAMARRELRGGVPLIGFGGSPWTLAVYMLEGGASRDFTTSKTLLYQRPDSAERLLKTLTHATCAYLDAQAAHGAEVLMLFDTWGGVLSGDDYRRFSLAPMAEVIGGLQQRDGSGRRVPVIVFTRGAGEWLEDIAACGCDAVGLDWQVGLGAARQRIGAQVAVQGNLDPAVLLGGDAVIRDKVATLLKDWGPHAGHVFNLGHGILPVTDPDKLALALNTLHHHSPQYH